MPSYSHELLVQLFRNQLRLAAGLLRDLQMPLPDHSDVHIESADVGSVQPAEYRADLVLFLSRGSKKVLGIIVEVQLQRDDDKKYVWPAYIANLRARHRCPVCLLVTTVDDVVRRWAAEPIDLGGGSRIKPWVIGPSNTPAVTDPQRARDNLELAVLSAKVHGHGTDVQLAARIASTAIVAAESVDAKRSKLYIDLILTSLSKDAREALKTMNSLGYEYESDFARHYVDEGRMEGRKEMVLQQLVLRFGPLEDEARARVRSTDRERLNIMAERILTARTLGEALEALQ